MASAAIATGRRATSLTSKPSAAWKGERDARRAELADRARNRAEAQAKADKATLITQQAELLTLG